jgi:hypothetical protein
MTNLPYQTDDVKLREHLEALLREQRTYFEMKLAAREDAMRSAHSSMEARLAGMNEFREALKDQTSTMITRTEFNIVCDRTQAELAGLQKFRNVAEGKASQSSVIFFGFLSVASLLISLIKLLTG